MLDPLLVYAHSPAHSCTRAQKARRAHSVTLMASSLGCPVGGVLASGSPVGRCIFSRAGTCLCRWHVCRRVTAVLCRRRPWTDAARRPYCATCVDPDRASSIVHRHSSTYPRLSVRTERRAGAVTVAAYFTDRGSHGGRTRSELWPDSVGTLADRHPVMDVSAAMAPPSDGNMRLTSRRRGAGCGARRVPDGQHRSHLEDAPKKVELALNLVTIAWVERSLSNAVAEWLLE